MWEVSPWDAKPLRALGGEKAAQNFLGHPGEEAKSLGLGELGAEQILRGAGWLAWVQGPEGRSSGPGEGGFSPFIPPAWGREPKSAFSGWAHLAVAPPAPQHQSSLAPTSTRGPRWFLPRHPQTRVLVGVGIGAGGFPPTFEPYWV